MSQLKLFATALGFLVVTTSASQAGMYPCAKHTDLVKLLDTKYREQLHGAGIGGQQSMIELYVSEKGSFTVLATSPQGLSCIVATGQSWERENVDAKKDLSSL
jgi:hypothetical protein